MTCKACGVNQTTGKNQYCDTCQIAIRKANQQIATLKHRERARSGRARHNLTYKGELTEWAKKHPEEVLVRELSSKIKMPVLIEIVRKAMAG